MPAASCARRGWRCRRRLRSLTGSRSARVRDLSRRAVRAVATTFTSSSPTGYWCRREESSHVLLREAHRSGAGPARLSRPHAAVVPVRTRELASGRAGHRRSSGRRRRSSRSATQWLRYIEQYCGVEPHVIHPPMYGAAAISAIRFVRSGIRADGQSVRRQRDHASSCDWRSGFPTFRLRALTGWGTTRADREAMRALPNVADPRERSRTSMRCCRRRACC